MSAVRLLLVDDDERYLDLLQFHLEVDARLAESELEIRRATSADEALELLAEYTPDLIVSDVNMPGKDGLAFRRAAREERIPRGLPVLFATGEDPEKGELRWARPLVSKQEGPDAVVRHVRAMLPQVQDEGVEAPVETGLGERSSITGWQLRRKLYPLSKRALDMLVSACALICLLPLFLVVGALIKLHDGGPIFYTQMRVGRGGRQFPFYKFRSMSTKSDVERKALVESDQGNDALRFKMKNDPRITPVGRFIRRFSIDELPQFWNVLCGDMTIVGPRPPIPEEVEQYGARAWRRLDVKPGLTCTWQTGGRSDIPFEQQVEMDLEYIHRRNAGKDVGLIAKTVPAVLKGKGAY